MTKALWLLIVQNFIAGRPLTFDGVNDYVDAGTLDITGYTAISISAYVKVDSFAATSVPLSIQHTGADDVRIVFTSTEKIELGVDDGTYYRVLTDVKTDEWYFTTLTFDGTTLKGYLNGVEFDSIAASFDFSTATGVINLGQRVGTGFSYDGQIANAKAFNVALTAAQVADLYNNPEKVVPTGVDNTALKLWLPMQEGAGTTAYDGSGNGNHGTISGATYTHGIGAPVSQTAVIDWNKGTNLVAQSAALQGNWTLNGGTWTSGQDDPFGGTDAYKITSTGSDPRVDKPATSGISGTQYTAKCWVKGAVGREARLWIIRDNVNFESQDFTLTGNWQEIETTKTFPTTPVSFVSFRLDIPNDSPGSGDVGYLFAPRLVAGDNADVYVPTLATAQTSPVLLPQGLTTGRDITGVNLFENVRKQGALNLDGNSWAEVHDNASVDFTTGLTLEAWVYWNANKFYRLESLVNMTLPRTNRAYYI